VIDFEGFPKIPRLSRPCCITEKIDGTNAQVYIRQAEVHDLPDGTRIHPEPFEFGVDIQVTGKDGLEYYIRAGSKSRWLRLDDDNFRFANWVYQQAPELVELGPGRHFGEWWGHGIQRGYGQERKRFSLFNTKRWLDRGNITIDPVTCDQQPNTATVPPPCCDVVPVIVEGMFSTALVNMALDTLARVGSLAAPGFNNPEGVIVYHAALGGYFKKTLHKDEEWKGKK